MTAFTVLTDPTDPNDPAYGKYPTETTLADAYNNRTAITSPNIRADLDDHYNGLHDLSPDGDCLACRHPNLLDV